MEFSRKEQLDSALTALEKHGKFADAIRKARQNHLAQTSQLRGLYEEVDKLTKSKSVVPPSDLLVEVVNTQIADAKALYWWRGRRRGGRRWRSAPRWANSPWQLLIRQRRI